VENPTIHRAKYGDEPHFWRLGSASVTYFYCLDEVSLLPPLMGWIPAVKSNTGDTAPSSSSSSTTLGKIEGTAYFPSDAAATSAPTLSLHPLYDSGRDSSRGRGGGIGGLEGGIDGSAKLARSNDTSDNNDGTPASSSSSSSASSLSASWSGRLQTFAQRWHQSDFELNFSPRQLTATLDALLPALLFAVVASLIALGVCEIIQAAVFTASLREERSNTNEGDATGKIYILPLRRSYSNNISLINLTHVLEYI
jgi:hypothetical protein